MNILLYEEKRLVKFEKWVSKVLKKVLVVYNSYTIY